MPEIVKISAIVDDARALSSLQNLKAICEQLNNTTINIKAEVNGPEKLTNAMTRLAVAQEKSKQESIKLQTAQEKTAQSANKLATQQAKNQGATQRAAQAQSTFNKQAQEGSKVTQILGDSIGNIAVKMVAWQVMGTAVSSVLGAFRDSLSTIKEVDSELATIRKVTDMTAEDAQALGQSSYDTASQYGIQASEYLQNVAKFARAGYGDAAEGLGELAIKTQLVGDTNAETASQFLLSADAAWKYKGNVEQLSLVLDKANEIDNNYATSIEKIADGLPIVANVAAMAGMSADETMAALGTITATTQESGRKAATALRALILNILGDTTTEIEEGVTATEESVESLGQILAKYAPEAVAAAEATGELINPMEAIEALSKAAKEGLLTETDLMQLVSSLGGKLRSNQLQALLQNFDMYKSMLGDMATAAGSADKEVSVMLDTWTGKANILKNTWTEFVSNFANTETIKGGLDVLTGVVEILNSDLGQTAIEAALVTTALSLVYKGGAKGFTAIATGARALALSLGPLPAGANMAAAAIRGLTASLMANPLFWIAAGTTAVIGISKIIDSTTSAFERQQEVVSELQSEYDSLYGSGSEYDQLISKADTLTEKERARLSVLEAQKSILDAQLQEEKANAFTAFTKDWNSRVNVGSGSLKQVGGVEIAQKGASILANFRNEVERLDTELSAGGITQEQYNAGLADLLDSTSDVVSSIKEYAAENKTLEDGMLELAEAWDSEAARLGELVGTSEDAADATEGVKDSLDEAAKSANSAKDALDEYKNALSGLTDYGANADSMQSAFNKAMEDLNAGKLNTPSILSFIDMTVPADVQQELGYNIQSMMDYALNSAMGGIFGSDNVAQATFNYITDAFSSGALDGIVEMQDGAITAISSWSELAAVMGTTEGVAKSLVESIIAYSDTGFYTAEEATALATQVENQLGGVGLSLQDGTANLGDFVSAFKNASGAINEADLANKIEAWGRAMGIDWAAVLGVDNAEAAAEMIASAVNEAFNDVDEAKGSISDAPINIRFNTNAAETAQAISNVETTTDEVDGKSATLSVSANGVEGAAQNLANLAAKAGEVVGSVNVDVSTDADSAVDELGKVRDTANSIPGSKTITVSVNNQASYILSGIISQIAAIQSKTVTITTIHKDLYGSGWGDDGRLIPRKAEGTQHAPRGPALVNDGAPVHGSAAELIIDNGDAYIANEGRPAIVDLSSGARVFTAQETYDIFNNTKKTFLQAFAGGTGLSMPSGNSGIYGGGYSGGTGSGGSGASDRASDDDDFKKEINDKLNNIDKQIKLAQNRNDTAREQALLQEAAKLTKDYVQQYLDKGYSNTSDEVLDLLNRGYGYSDDLMNELVDALEALTDTSKAANRLAEKQQELDEAKVALENVQKQRTVRIYNPVTGQWEWVAKAEDIQKAQENLVKAEKELHEEQLSQELEALKNGNIGDIGQLTISPALRELMGDASEEEQRRITDILNAIYGGATKTKDTTGESVFRSTDSHDVYYQFGDLKLSETQAANMTVKELAQQLKALAIT